MATTAETPPTTPLDIRSGWLTTPRELRGVVTFVVAALLLAPSFAICIRRACGAFDRPLLTEGLVGAGLLALLGAEVLWRLVGREPNAVVVSRFAALAGAASSLMLAAGLSLPGSSPVGLLILWAMAILETGLGAWRIRNRDLILRPVEPSASSDVGSAVRTKCPLPDSSVAVVSSSVRTADPASTLKPAAAHADREGEATLEDAHAAPSDDPLAPGVVQQLLRREEPNGVHWLSGLVRVRFDPGQRVTHAHVAFCPPFLTTPTCEAETIAGPDAQVKISQLLPHGVRFEARLDEASAQQSDVVIEFATHWPAS